MGGKFRAMGKLNLLDGQNNLLGGQMPTQLICYLRPFQTILISGFGKSLKNHGKDLMLQKFLLLKTYS